MLEFVTDPSRINIGNLNIEEPAPREELFDVRESIRHKDLTSLANVPLPQDLDVISEFHRKLFMLLPDRFQVKSLRRDVLLKKYREINSDETFFKMDEQLDKLARVAQMQFLFPNTELLDDEVDWGYFKAYFANEMNLPGVQAEQEELRNFFGDACYVGMISQEKVKELNLDNDSVWQEGITQLEIWQENKKWGDFLEMAAQMKTLSPEKFKEFKITDQDWKGIKEYFEEMIEPDAVISFVDTGGDILILQADEIRLTSEKVEVIMPKKEESFENLVPALPETRKF
ncbi:MAG: hypothetical protein Q7R49_01715 [Candidatus Daviesbacteria bacterium]|nr:hypothetical protein [Candidatus Daviesbacteria bacterium]